MKDKKRLAILTGILLILLALLIGLRFFNKKEEAKKEQQEQESQIEVTDFGGELKSITYKNDSGKVQLRKKEDQWYFAGDTKTELDQSYPDTMESEILGLTAERELEDLDELQYYGLDEPVYTIRAVDEDGKEMMIYIGSALDNEYYFTVDDKEKIYVGASTLVSSIQYEKDQLIKKETEDSEGDGDSEDTGDSEFSDSEG